jgi:hypothetical protein
MGIWAAFTDWIRTSHYWRAGSKLTGDIVPGQARLVQGRLRSLFAASGGLQNRTSGQNAMKWALLTISKWTATSPAVRLKNARNPITTAFCPLCPVAKGFAGETAKVTATNGRAEPGLSWRRVQELADWYSDEGHQRYCENTLDTATLDAELRTALAEEVFPELVEIEFERVMKVVFASQ